MKELKTSIPIILVSYPFETNITNGEEVTSLNISAEILIANTTHSIYISRHSTRKLNKESMPTLQQP